MGTLTLCPHYKTSDNYKFHYNKGLEPYKFGWDGDVKKLYKGKSYSCQESTGYYCTAIIQLNGWKIPKDYPKKIKF